MVGASMNTQTQEALKMAIEDAMKFVNTLNGYEDANQSKPFKTEADKYLSYASVVIKSLATSLQEALAQPAQDSEQAPCEQPVAWMELKEDAGYTEITVWQEPVSKKSIPLYTHPAPLQNKFAKTTSWQGLSNDRIREIGDNCLENNNGLFNWIDFARAIEQALKEKNT